MNRPFQEGNRLKKVFVLGLDGATFDLINPWIEEGRLPHIAQLVREGVSGTLISTIPDHSAAAWSSFITGKNPGKHGLFHFSEHAQDSYKVRFVNASMRDGSSLWSFISTAGKKVGILNVPMTYPPEKVNGFMVSGMDSPGPNSDFTYPSGICEELQRNIGGYRIEFGLWSFISKGQIDLVVQKQKEAARQRFAAMRYLMDHYPWEFFMAVFTATDRAQHAFWKYMDPEHPLYSPEFNKRYGSHILSIYEEMDQIVKYLLERLDDETVLMVMSDHGAGPCGARSLYLNNWLREKGLLFFKDTVRPTSSFTIGRVKNVLYTNWLGSLPRRLWGSLTREKKDLLMKVFPSLVDSVASRFYFSRIDMEKTKAYAEESKTFIWINKKRGDSMGIVESNEEYEELRDFIIKELHDLRCPETDERVIARAYRKEEIYHGRHVHKAPDIVITFRPRGYVPRPSYSVDRSVVLQTLSRDILENDEFNLRENGRHQPNGILMVRGKMIKKGHVAKDAHIMDLAPTILHTMGLPVPDDMDGKVLSDIFEPDVMKEHPITYSSWEKGEAGHKEVTPYSATEEEMVQERLRDLGYL
jgi:predicted AlkP superfamily phosphohydrolase/phosphomutase